MADINLFGNTSESPHANAISLFRVVGGAAIQSGRVSQLRLYSNTAGSIKLAVYANNESIAGALIAATDPSEISIGWNYISISQFNVTADEIYWFGMFPDRKMQVMNAVSSYPYFGYITGLSYSDFEFPSPPTGLTYPGSSTTFPSLSAWGALASGAAGRLIGPSHRIGGASPIIGSGGAGIGW